MNFDLPFQECFLFRYHIMIMIMMMISKIITTPPTTPPITGAMENSKWKLHCRVYKTFNLPAGSAFWVGDVIVDVIVVIIVVVIVDVVFFDVFGIVVAVEDR